jgi:hypothetical protein
MMFTEIFNNEVLECDVFSIFKDLILVAINEVKRFDIVLERRGVWPNQVSVWLSHINSQSPRTAFIPIDRNHLGPHSRSAVETITTAGIRMSSIVGVNVAIAISGKMTFGPEINRVTRRYSPCI